MTSAITRRKLKKRNNNDPLTKALCHCAAQGAGERARRMVANVSRDE
jgi:hypothetical protein